MFWGCFLDNQRHCDSDVTDYDNNNYCEEAVYNYMDADSKHSFGNYPVCGFGYFASDNCGLMRI